MALSIPRIEVHVFKMMEYMVMDQYLIAGELT